MTARELAAAVVELARRYSGPPATIHLGGYGAGEELAEALAAIPGATRKVAAYERPGEPPYAIESVMLNIGSVCLDAQWASRPATASEIAAVRSPDAYVPVSVRSIGVDR